LKPVNHVDSRHSNASKVPGASASGYTSHPKYQVSDLHVISDWLFETIAEPAEQPCDSEFLFFSS